VRVRFFSVPAWQPGDEAEELNRFLAGHRVLAIDRQLVATQGGGFWAVAVTYLAGAASAAPQAKRGKVDYREVLSPEDFGLFARLRSLRRELADAEGQPPYALFSNEQLAALAQKRPATAAELGAIPGIGPARVERYGARFLAALHAEGEPLPSEEEP
jgi:superfamily II DNA helicase RecQ